SGDRACDARAAPRPFARAQSRARRGSRTDRRLSRRRRRPAAGMARRAARAVPRSARRRRGWTHRAALPRPTPPPALPPCAPGPPPRRARYGEATYPFGANISFRAAAARDAGGFSPAVGLHGRRQTLHEETDLCYRLEHAGGIVWYAPDAVVDHHV